MDFNSIDEFHIGKPKGANHWISSTTYVNATRHIESFSVHWVDCYYNSKVNNNKKSIGQS